MSSRPPLIPDDPKHGTRGAYLHHGCRCDPCTEAAVACRAAYYAANAEQAREQSRAYYAANRDRLLARRRALRKAITGGAG